MRHPITRSVAARRLRTSAIAILGAGFVVACALTRFETPHLTVIKVEMVDGDILSQRFKVRLRAQNPNDRELPVRGINCNLELDGEEFGEGVSAEEFTIPAYGEADFDMLLTTNLAGAVARVIGNKDRGEAGLEYRLSGKINLAKGFMHSIPFSDSGRLPTH